MLADAVGDEDAEAGQERDDRKERALAAQQFRAGEQERQTGGVGGYDCPLPERFCRAIAEGRERPFGVRPGNLRNPRLFDHEVTGEPQVGLADVSIRVGATGDPRAPGRRRDRECEREPGSDKSRPPGQRMDGSRPGADQHIDDSRGSAAQPPNRLTRYPATRNEVTSERDTRDDESAIRVVRPDRDAEQPELETSEDRQRSRPRRRRADCPEKNGADRLHEQPLAGVTRTLSRASQRTTLSVKTPVSMPSAGS